MSKRAKKPIWKRNGVAWALRRRNGKLETNNCPLKGPSLFRTKFAAEHHWLYLATEHTTVSVRIVATATEVRP